MIVKDSTTNQVHNDSNNTDIKKKKSIKRLRSDASEWGAPERAPPVEETSQIHHRHTRTHTHVSAAHAALTRDLRFHLSFFGLDSLKKKNLLVCNNKKEDLGEKFFLLSKHDKHYIQSW